MDALIIGCINKVPTSFIERVEQLETGFLVHRPHSEGGPFVSNAHRAQLEWRNAHCSIGAKDAIAGQWRLWFGDWCPERHFSGGLKQLSGCVWKKVGIEEDEWGMRDCCHSTWMSFLCTFELNGSSWSSVCTGPNRTMTTTVTRN